MYHIVRRVCHSSNLSKVFAANYNAKPAIVSRTAYRKIIRSTTLRSSSTAVLNEDSFVKKFMKKVGWLDRSQTRLKLAGYFLYGNVSGKVSYNDWFEKCKLPDTFTSWFIVTELHVWILMVRCMAEDLTASSTGKKYVNGNGVLIRNCIVEALWADVANRIKLLQDANPTVARKQVSELSEQFQAALVGYDEGLEDDRALAAAVWRRVYAMAPDASATDVEAIVSFIRHQISLLDKLSSKELGFQPNISWLSISDHLVN